MPTDPLAAIRERWGIGEDGVPTRVGRYADIATLLALVDTLKRENADMRKALTKTSLVGSAGYNAAQACLTKWPCKE